jgi:hypothetical protein
MKQTLQPYWCFSRFMAKGFLRLQLFDTRTNTSYFCEEIPEFTHGTHDIYGFDN